jgi:hypothetical protein
VIVLSDDFYQEVLAHPVPNDLEAVKLLAAAPAVLDLYMWLSLSLFHGQGLRSDTNLWRFWARQSIGLRGVQPASTLPRDARTVAGHDPCYLAAMSGAHRGQRTEHRDQERNRSL